jgi:hypothetical protein
LGTKVALLSSVTFDIAEDLKPHQVTIPLMKLTTESFSEVKPPDTKRKFSIIKKEAASAGTLELKVCAQSSILLTNSFLYLQ